MTITANVSKMFASIEPCYVSGSRAELGESAGQITWRNAMDAAKDVPPAWLLSDPTEALAGIREWASGFGAWDDEEIAGWSNQECYALFVQQIASELRMLGSDNAGDLEDLAEVYAETDWENEYKYPTGSYYLGDYDGDVFPLCVQFYTGC